jgi:cell division protein FtsW (lipid II flippase)
MQRKSIDTTLVFMVLGLVIFGMIMISSVSVYASFSKTSRAAGEAINYLYVLNNIIHVLIGIVALAVVSKIPYTFLEKHAKTIF